MARSLAVLVVEDDLAIQELIVELLSEEGYYVKTAANVASARAALVERQWDLLLTDFWLAESSGLVLAREVGRAVRIVPVVLMTADPNVHSFDLSDIAFCLLKPFDLNVLLECVATYILREM